MCTISHCVHFASWSDAAFRSAFSGLVRVRSWRATINDMLRSIPTVSAERLDVYFDTIDAKLGVYENLLNEASSLFPEQFGLVEGIVLNILSFTDCDDDIETIPLADASLAMVLEKGLEGYFVYYDWMENEDIPMEVTHIRVHSSVRAIQDGIFFVNTTSIWIISGNWRQ